MTKAEEKALAPMEQFRGTIHALSTEFKAALPPQIPVERFIRTVITTVQMNPSLLECDRKSVLATCMKAAQDGLLLDGREAAAIPFRSKTGGKTCQYIPMVAGVLKKMRNSGEIASVAAHSVHEKDFFEYELGDNERIIHKPFVGGDRGPMILVYGIVRTKDGGVYREVMTRTEVEKVRSVSKAKDDGPWVTWYEEQAEKTVLKRLAKRCPSSSDVEKVIEADNEALGFIQRTAEEIPPAAPGEVAGQSSYLNALKGNGDAKPGPEAEKESPPQTTPAEDDGSLPFDEPGSKG